MGLRNKPPSSLIPGHRSDVGMSPITVYGGSVLPLTNICFFVVLNEFSQLKVPCNYGHL